MTTIPNPIPAIPTWEGEPLDKVLRDICDGNRADWVARGSTLSATARYLTGLAAERARLDRFVCGPAQPPHFPGDEPEGGMTYRDLLAEFWTHAADGLDTGEGAACDDYRTPTDLLDQVVRVQDADGVIDTYVTGVDYLNNVFIETSGANGQVDEYVAWSLDDLPPWLHRIVVWHQRRSAKRADRQIREFAS